MNKEHTEQFEDWKKRQILQFCGLRKKIGNHIYDVEDLCREAFEDGLNTCVCEGCIRHSGSYFDVEKYYE